MVIRRGPEQSTPLDLINFGVWNPNMVVSTPAPSGGFGSRGDHDVATFDDTTAEQMWFAGAAARGYAGQDLYLNIEWVAATATSGDVLWSGSFDVSAPDGHDIDTAGFAAEQTALGTANATSGVITRTQIQFTQAQADGIAAGDAFTLRLRRNAADASDTMVGDAQVLRVSLASAP